MDTRYSDFKVVITKIGRLIHKIEGNEIGQINLKTQHISTLYYLYISKKLMAKEIVEKFAEDKGQVSRALDFLETNGLISCQSDAKKRYNAYYTLTPQGEKVAEYVANKIEEMVKKAVAGLEEEEKNIMYKCLNIITENLEKIS